MERRKLSGMLWRGVGGRDLVIAVPYGKRSCLPFDGKSHLEAAGGEC